MLDRTMSMGINTANGEDVKLELTAFTIGKVEDDDTDGLENYITETYIPGNTFDLVKCELGDSPEAFTEDLIIEEEAEEEEVGQAIEKLNVSDTEAKGGLQNTKDIENIFLTDDFRCTLCLKIFSSQTDLDVHVSLYNPSEIYHCSYCVQSFHTKKMWSDHVETHIQSKEFICMVCLRCCSSPEELKVHLSHHPDISGQKSAENREVDVGLATVTYVDISVASNISSTSSFPSFKFDVSSTRNGGASAKKAADESQKYVCAICNAKFRRRKTMVGHLANHTHFCADCGQAFVTKERLKYHIRRQHDQVKCNVCEKCGKSFSSKSALNKHVLVHGESTPYLCLLCNKHYSSKASLTTHARLHNGLKQFRCSVCGKGFQRKDRLDSHQVLHGAEAPNMCPYCGKCISRRENLKYHLRLHTGEKPFQCDVCLKMFPSQTALKKHAIIHTDKALFTCHICQRTIARKDNFLAHLRIHSGEGSIRKRRKRNRRCSQSEQEAVINDRS